jgi:hypothetical protein
MAPGYSSNEHGNQVVFFPTPLAGIVRRKTFSLRAGVTPNTIIRAHQTCLVIQTSICIRKVMNSIRCSLTVFILR